MHMCKNQIALSTENANTETQCNTAVWGHFRARLPESEIQALLGICRVILGKLLNPLPQFLLQTSDNTHGIFWG